MCPTEHRLLQVIEGVVVQTKTMTKKRTMTTTMTATTKRTK